MIPAVFELDPETGESTGIVHPFCPECAPADAHPAGGEDVCEGCVCEGCGCGCDL